MMQRRKAAVGVAVMMVAAATVITAAPARSGEPQPTPAPGPADPAAPRLDGGAAPPPRAERPTTAVGAQGASQTVDLLDTPDGDAQPQFGAEAAQRYGGLSASMVQFYALAAGGTVAEFGTANRHVLAEGLGVSDPTAFSLRDSGELAERISGTGAQLQRDNLDALAGSLLDSSGWDGEVARRGALWTSEMTSLRAPELQSPSVPQVGGPDLAVGALLDRSATAMLTDFPDLFASLGTAGVGSAAHRDAWNTSMLRAFHGSQGDLFGSMPDRCTAEALAVAASGDPSDGDGGCADHGMYLHRQIHTAVFEPESRAVSRTAPTGGLLPPAQFDRLPDWMRAGMTEIPPELSDDRSSQAFEGQRRSLLDGAMPDIFGQLSPR